MGSKSWADRHPRGMADLDRRRVTLTAVRVMRASALLARAGRACRLIRLDPPERGTLGSLLLDTRCNYCDQSDWRSAIDFCMKKVGRSAGSPRRRALLGGPVGRHGATVALGAGSISRHRGERRGGCGALQDDGIVYLAKQHDELLTRVLPAEQMARSPQGARRGRSTFRCSASVPVRFA
jgi:hypothetical protein